jgi:hypothetical protein
MFTSNIRRVSVQIFLLLFFTCSFLYSQDNPLIDSVYSIEDEILQYESDLMLVSKARALLIQSVKKGDSGKANEVMEYIGYKFDEKKIIALFPEEKILLNYWLREYEDIFTAVTSTDFENINYNDKLVPLRDLLYSELSETADRDKNELTVSITSSNLPVYKKDFLYLLLKYFIMRDNVSSGIKEREQINRDADEYLSLYSDSEFNPFIRNYIRFVIAESPWGYGVELSFGYLTLPVNLRRHVEDYGLISVALETAYQNIYSNLRLEFGPVNRITKEFEYDGIWQKDLEVNHTSVSLHGGYIIPLGNNFKFTPLAGISWLDFSPPDEIKKDVNDVEMSMMAWSIGFNFDIPFDRSEGVTFIRVHAAHKISNTDISFVKGGYTYITLGIDLFGRPKYRDF